MSSSKELQAAIKKLKAFNFPPKMELSDFREKFDSTFSSVFLPNRVEKIEKNFDGVPACILQPEIYSSHRIMIYIHGGSFTGGSAKAYLPFAAALANATSSKTVVPDFRLPPSHPYPAGLEDVQKVFRTVYSEEIVAQSLNSENGDASAKPEIIIAADDSGASIAAALILSLKGRFRTSIRQLFLFSPILNIAESNPILTGRKSKDDIFTGKALRRCAEFYTFTENRTKAYISPVFVTADMLEDFPPVYIQIGEREFFLDDAICFQQILTGSGIRCELEVCKGMIHMFQLADEYLREAHLAIERIGKIITSKKSGSESVTEIGLVLEKSRFSTDSFFDEES